MSKTLFQEKIQYLFNELKISPDSFIELFLKKGQRKSDRKKTVIDKWLNGEMKGRPTVFSFLDYEISGCKIDSERAFSEDSFLRNSLGSFKIEVDNYIVYKDKPIELLEYKYVYYYYKKKHQIVHASLNTLKKINNNEYKVELIPPSSKVNIQPYKGVLKINNERYYISVENDVEILTLYFVLGRGYADNSKVHGIGLGISHQGGLVEASKELLTKEKLSSNEENEFYLVANESEYLISDEVVSNEYTNTEFNHLKSFHQKIDNLASFMHNSKEMLEENIYLNIFNETFENFYQVSTKVAKKQEFSIFRRRNAIENFLRNIAQKENSFCTIVYPLFGNDTDLFDKTEERCRGFLELNIQLAKDGLKLNRIFIIDETYKVTNYLIESMKRLRTAGVNVSIAWKKDIEKLSIGSYDFVLSKEKDVALYKNSRDKIHIYYVTENLDEVQSLFYDYQKIEEVSTKLDVLLSKSEFGDEINLELDLLFSKQNLREDTTLSFLVGEWYYYAYGSLIVDMTEFRLWHSIIIIHKDATAHYKYKNMTQHSGTIDTKYNQNQSYIRFTNHDSQHLALIMIDNENLYKDVFKVTMMRKQFGLKLDMAQFGIFSRKKLDEVLVKKALGKIDETMMRENIELENRINELYIESKF